MAASFCLFDFDLSTKVVGNSGLLIVSCEGGEFVFDSLFGFDGCIKCG